MESKEKKFSGKPRRKNYRGKKSYDKSSSRMTKGKDEEVMQDRPGGNDPRWWGTKEFVDAVGKFPYAYPLGQKIPWSFVNDPQSSAQMTMNSSEYATHTVPGFMTIDVLPTLGVCRYAVDYPNAYLRAIYSKLRSTNNQSAPYYAPDLGMYLMAIDSVYMGLDQLVRIYGAARTYSPLNRYLPTAMLNAMGINPTHPNYNLYGNLANFRAKILALMVKIRTLNFPKGINFNTRHRQLVSFVYADGENSKAQCYVFRTPYLYKYKATYNESGGGLEAAAVPAYGSSAAEWISFVETLIDAFIDDQDFAIISGDIAKSFGYESLIGMSYIDENYSVVPIHNPEILLEIHNLKVSGDRYANTSFDLYQDASLNAFVCAPYCGTTDGTVGPVNVLIDVPIDSPDSDTNMVATRLTTVGPYTYDTGTSKYKFVPITLGTELVVDLVIWYYDDKGSLKSYTTYTNAISSAGSTFTYKGIMNVAKESFFDWHPHQYVLHTDSNGNLEFYGCISELSDYTVIESGALNQLNQVALFGALTINGLDTVGLK